MACDSEPGDATLVATEARLDRVAETFARIVDGKSRDTEGHSTEVAALAVRIGRELALEPRAMVELRRAGLLHDLGKVAVPNVILDKRGPLTVEEWETVRLHPYYTHRVLERTPGFDARVRGVGAPRASRRPRLLRGCTAPRSARGAHPRGGRRLPG